MLLDKLNYMDLRMMIFDIWLYYRGVIISLVSMVWDLSRHIVFYEDSKMMSKE